MNLTDIRNSKFLKQVSTLLTGTLLAQIIGFSIYPFITRIYSTSEIGEFAYFNRWVFLVAAIATLRYEIALPLPKKDKDGFSLYRLSILLSWIVLALVAVVLFFSSIDHEINAFSLIWGLCLLFGIYGISRTNLGVSWSIRKAWFKLISIQQVTAAFVSNGLKLILGLFSFGAIGLIIGSAIGFLTGGLFYLRSYLGLRKEYISESESHDLLEQAKIYKQFPMFNFPHVLLDFGIDVLVAILIVANFGKGTFGSFSHAYLILKLPLGLIGMSMGQVFQNRCVELINSDQKILPLVKKSMFTLFLLCLLPFGVLFFFGGDLFAFVFGENWRFSGELAQIMSPFLAINFIVSPLSSLPQIVGKQRPMLFLGVLMALWQVAVFGGLSANSLMSDLSFNAVLMIHTIGMICILGITFC
ncbi:MAG: hypothetical protein KJ941_00320, partial [Bacteroidetes bacterium]|nr:hypothetical protein [Bacteroidota bacterium]